MPTHDPPEFLSLMAEVQRVTLALDDHLQRDGSKATARAVSAGVRVYAQLREYRDKVKMTASELTLLQAATDLLRARLRFFGEPV